MIPEQAPQGFCEIVLEFLAE
jgi:hypothetical protein